MADFCISDDLRQLLEFMKNSPDLMLRTIRTVPSCSAPKQTVSPVPEDNLPCQQRIDNVAESVLVMKQLIREGAPAELQEVMAKTFLDIGKCGTPLLVETARSLFKEINKTTGTQYFKGEGNSLNRKLDELIRVLKGDCFESGCYLPLARPVPLTINNRLPKVGLVER